MLTRPFYKFLLYWKVFHVNLEGHTKFNLLNLFSYLSMFYLSTIYRYVTKNDNMRKNTNVSNKNLETTIHLIYILLHLDIPVIFLANFILVYYL